MIKTTVIKNKKTMNIKYGLISAAAMALVCTTGLVGCSAEGNDFDFNKNGLLITGTETTPVQKLIVEDTPSSYAITVKSTRKAAEDTKVTLLIDTAAVSRYNRQNGSDFYSVPLSCIELESSEVTIKAGSAVSGATAVKVVSTDGFVGGRSYMIPVSIKSASGGVEDVVEPSRTLFIRIGRIINFHHLTYDAAGSSQYNFSDDKSVTFTKYTIQFKVFPTNLTGPGNLRRFLSLKGGGDGSNMFRFDESGKPNGSLQWVLPGGDLVSNTSFKNNKWYLVTCTYDGTDYKMYVDDNATPDKIVSVPDKSWVFKTFELGMSWAGYQYNQYFKGRLAEIRLWNKCLSPSAIATGLCGVDPQSDGLVAYWKMDQSSGHIIEDKTGHGYDMDWSDTWRVDNESDDPKLTHHDYSGYIHWGIDDNNKCSE